MSGTWLNALPLGSWKMRPSKFGNVVLSLQHPRSAESLWVTGREYENRLYCHAHRSHLFCSVSREKVSHCTGWPQPRYDFEPLTHLLDFLSAGVTDNEPPHPASTVLNCQYMVRHECPSTGEWIRKTWHLKTSTASWGDGSVGKVLTPQA